MVRSFGPSPLDPAVVDRVFHAGLTAPTAGNARGTAWVVLTGPHETARYWHAATTPRWRATSPRWPGLSRAPVVGISLCSPEQYLARYGAPDKLAGAADLRLDLSPASWPVPYWFADAASSVMCVLLAAVDEGLGACFLGNFREEAAVIASVGAPEGWRLFGAVALGLPDGNDWRSGSLDRPGPSAAERLHHGLFGIQKGAPVARSRQSGLPA